MKRIYLAALFSASAACNHASFGGKSGIKPGNAVLPDSRQENPEVPPLDVSQAEQNKRNFPDGPKAPTGAVLDKTIELSCDNSAGVIIDAGSSVPIGTEPLPTTNNAIAKLLARDTTIDTSGKIVEGGTPQPGGDEPLPVFPPIPVPEPMKAVARVKGQFCPTSHNKLTVLFVVDYSGSMGRHVEAVGQPEQAGNDPQVAGSCGRLRAAQAILTKIKSELKAGDQVQVGMVPFAGGIVTSKILKIVNLASFEAMVSKDTFCQYIVQDPSFGYDPINPGGIAGPPDGIISKILRLGHVDSSTNYSAAFTAAESLLRGVYGRKVTYFISDGEPTSGGADPVAAGVAAGASMRSHVDNLTLNAVLLGNMDASAQSVLEQVAGSSDRVRRADNADELAKQIALFPDASIDPSTGKASLTAAPYPTADLGLKYLKADPTNPLVWIYETQPFVLLGKPGVDTMNVVDVTARGADGTSYSATVKIRFRP